MIPAGRRARSAIRVAAGPSPGRRGRPSGLSYPGIRFAQAGYPVCASRISDSCEPDIRFEGCTICLCVGRGARRAPYGVGTVVGTKGRISDDTSSFCRGAGRFHFRWLVARFGLVSAWIRLHRTRSVLAARRGNGQRHAARRRGYGDFTKPNRSRDELLFALGGGFQRVDGFPAR